MRFFWSLFVVWVLLFVLVAVDRMQLSAHAQGTTSRVRLVEQYQIENSFYKVEYIKTSTGDECYIIRESGSNAIDCRFNAR